MHIEYSRRSALPVIGIALAAFATGVTLSGAVLSHQNDVRESELKRQLSARQARVALLESVLRRQPDTTLSLMQPQQQEEPTAEPAEPAKAAGKPKPVAPPKAGDKVAQAAAAADKPAAVEQRAPKDPARAAADNLPTPVSAEAIAVARQNNKILTVDAKDMTEKLGISKLENGAIVSRSGVRLPVGTRLPSGERLLFVDPVNQQIMTDQRTLMIF